MNFEDSRARVAGLPGIDSSTVVYFVSLALDEDPGAALITLGKHREGQYTATVGDLRSSVKSATDSEGEPLVFPDENAACEWAWEKVQGMRTPHQQDVDISPEGLQMGAEVEGRLSTYYRENGFDTPQG